MPGRAQIRAVLFDKDGTLFDFAATWRRAAHALIERLAPDDPDRRRALGAACGFDIESGAFAAGSVIVAGSADALAHVWAPMTEGLDAKRLEALALDASAAAGGLTLTPAAPDLPGLLDGLLARGLALGVATHDGEAAARDHLAAVGALDRFSFIAGYDSGHAPKPAPDMVLAFAAAAGVAPRAVAMIGDSVHDLGAARAAGALAIGVLTGPARHDDLAPLADAILPSIAALPDWLDARDRVAG
ncbi:HAD family hydrolase [Rubrimonas cliftonensis]|uniref:phosphoglycolate phosphatase n=1 Tax=Rubrimonas cliftonensis TaxID=89524 RepID=A0A1H3X8H9_9RHOB|nr:HAD-IA family hydrolase [Rubrimonas cliftonensis]SDZ95697.1 phosphoglycolate phosphatase [Rubrimonas cliftonensis]